MINMIVHCGIFKALIKDLAAIHPLLIGIIVLQGNVPPQSRIGGSSMGFQVKLSIKALHRNDNDRRPTTQFQLQYCSLPFDVVPSGGGGYSRNDSLPLGHTLDCLIWGGGHSGGTTALMIRGYIKSIIC